ncbi:MAG TPA: VCBS repeat-containing protein, partial [Clostridia bacterium]|nr:VCBS repeat-containing protein [Clostridia bacterium]
LLFPKMKQPKQAFRNRGDLTFEDAAAFWGFNQVGVAHGMAFADLDNDGDLDAVVNNLGESAGLYRNRSSASRVGVRLKGNPPNTQGIGAKVSLIAEMDSSEAGAKPLRFVQTQEIMAGGRYLSSDEPVRVFAGDLNAAFRRLHSGPGSQSSVEGKAIRFRLDVLWRSGRRSAVENVSLNNVYEIAESTAQAPTAPGSDTAATKPLFEDFSSHIPFLHRDELFDDFERQPLLPRKLSQAGPGISWFDVDRDGHEDLVIGSGRGGQLAVFRGDGRGGFVQWINKAVEDIVSRDQTCVLGTVYGPNGTSTCLLAGASNYEDGAASGSLARVYDVNAGTVTDPFPGQESSTGPLALADINHDGSLDLFVGGRCIPGKWPASATSLLFKNRAGRYELDVTNTVSFAGAGLVSGATFADLNGDGWPDLVLACEWGPIRVFLNQRGHLEESTKQLGLESYVGWWNGVTVGDFDADGQLDIAASNWGLNGGAAGYDRPALVANLGNQPRPGVPIVFWGDLGGGGPGLTVIEAEYDAQLGKVVPTRSFTAMAMGLPMVNARFQSFAAYNHASVEDLLGDEFASASKLAAPWLASTVFLKRSGKYVPVVLPPEAQFSPAYGICAADFDGDGNEDLILAQNCFSVQPHAVRGDAGRGVLLRGDGHGNFQSVPGHNSGFTVYGEGRGAAVCDFDKDGRADLAVGQNGAGTRLFHNMGAKPGLRIRINGVPGNPEGIGTQLRLLSSQGMGPIHEIRTGSGYCSQDSSVQVLTSAQPPTKLWVRWPGGQTNLFDLPSDAREILVSGSGVKRVESK